MHSSAGIKHVGFWAHLQALHDLVSNAAAAHSAHRLALDVIGFHCDRRHVPLIVDDLCPGADTSSGLNRQGTYLPR